MSYTYSSLINALALEAAVSNTDVNFLAVLPQIIDDSEQRIYRELDLLTSIITTSAVVTPDSRFYILPTSAGGQSIHFLVVDSIRVIDALGNRYSCVPATRETIDYFYPNNLHPYEPSYPKLFCRADDLNLVFGPPPDFAYNAEVVGTIRPNPLSVTNPTTYLSSYLSDLFFSGCMVAMCGYQRNFSAIGDDPTMAITWENMFQKRLTSAKAEEARKSFISAVSQPPQSPKGATNQ